jgi:hypothetical protein
VAGPLYGLYRRLSAQARHERLVLDSGSDTVGSTPSYAPLYLKPTEPPTNASEGAVYYDDDLDCLMQYNGSTWEEVGSSPTTLGVSGAVTFDGAVAVSDADGLTVNSVIVPAIQYMHFRVGPHASVTEYDLAIAKRALTVVSIDVVPSTLQGGALTATIVKATGTATPVNSTTPMHTANSINLNSGAYTVQSVTLTATAADLTLAAGERISIDYSAALTAGHAAITVGFKYV